MWNSLFNTIGTLTPFLVGKKQGTFKVQPPFKDGILIGSTKAHQKPNGGPPRPKLDQNKLGREQPHGWTREIALKCCYGVLDKENKTCNSLILFASPISFQWRAQYNSEVNQKQLLFNEELNISLWRGEPMKVMKIWYQVLWHLWNELAKKINEDESI